MSGAVNWGLPAEPAVRARPGQRTQSALDLITSCSGNVNQSRLPFLATGSNKSFPHATHQSNVYECDAPVVKRVRLSKDLQRNACLDDLPQCRIANAPLKVGAP